MRRRTTRRTATLAAVIVAMTLGLVATVAADDGGNRVRLQARMDGSQEVPPADPDGRGRAKITLNVVTDEICWDLRFSRIGTPSAGHIHLGGAGVNGGVVFTLIGPSTPPDPLERGEAEGCAIASAGLAAQIAANPGGYYVNLHNSRFPDGAIRGQLGRGGGDD
jgi:hypothetical protein